MRSSWVAVETNCVRIRSASFCCVTSLTVQSEASLPKASPTSRAGEAEHAFGGLGPATDFSRPAGATSPDASDRARPRRGSPAKQFQQCRVRPARRGVAPIQSAPPGVVASRTTRSRRRSTRPSPKALNNAAVAPARRPRRPAELFIQGRERPRSCSSETRHSSPGPSVRRPERTRVSTTSPVRAGAPKLLFDGGADARPFAAGRRPRRATSGAAAGPPRQTIAVGIVPSEHTAVATQRNTHARPNIMYRSTRRRVSDRRRTSGMDFEAGGHRRRLSDERSNSQSKETLRREVVGASAVRHGCVAPTATTR